MAKKTLYALWGNIAAGKTSALKEVRQSTKDGVKLSVVDENVERMVNYPTMSGGKVDVLKLYYEDEYRFALTFQNLIISSKIKECAKPATSDKIWERFVLEDLVFISICLERGTLSELQASILTEIIYSMAEILLEKYTIVVLRIDATPEECYKRLQIRARESESTVSLEYLQCYERHSQKILQDLVDRGLIIHRNIPNSHVEPWKVGNSLRSSMECALFPAQIDAVVCEK